MDLLTLIARIKLETKEYQNNLEKSEKLAKKTSKKIGNFFKVAGAGAGAIGAGLVAFGKKSVEAGMEFDKSMSQVAATMGVTVDEIQDLRDYAQEMGRTTAFSATEASEALNYMALAGYDAETSMKMLPNVLNLAAAGNIDLAEASDMVTDAQSALGLSLEETNEMVDKMAKASSKSNTSVEQLGQAFLTIGGTAKNLKGGTTELSTALGLLADNGIKGAEGGTALRNILLNLTPQSEDAAKAMEQIGLQAYDANGNMRSLKDIFSDMNKAMEPMTQQERTEILSTIFNKVDLKSVNALLATNVDRWDELTGAIDDSQGAAQKMAETQLDNLAGDITLFQSALEGLKIGISDSATPALRDFVKFGTDGLSELTEAFKTDGIEGAFDVLGKLLEKGTQLILSYVPKILEIAVKLIQALVEGISSSLPTLLPAIAELLPQLVDSGISIIFALADGITNAIPSLIPALVDVIDEIVDKLTNPDTLTQLIEVALALILALTEGLIDAIPKLVMEVPKIIDGIVRALIQALPSILNAGVRIMGELVRGIISAKNSVKLAFAQIFKDTIVRIKDFIKNFPQWGRDMVDGFVSGIKQSFKKFKDTIKSLADIAKSMLHFSVPDEGPLADADTYMPDMIDLFAQGIDRNKYRLANSVEGLAGTMADGMGYDYYYGGGSKQDTVQQFEFSFAEGGNQALNQIARLLLPYMKVALKEVGGTI